MRRILTVLVLSLLWPVSVASVQRQTTTVMVSSPQTGDVLQGVVTVTGSSAVDGFLSAEITFSYADDVTGIWFPIARAEQPVIDGILAIWDTSLITDGNYNLRLRVFLIDGMSIDVVIQNLRVRNYTPTEIPNTDTPTATLPPTYTPISPTPTETTIPSSTHRPTPTIQPTPTPLPTNPAILPAKDILMSILYGGATAVLSFLLLILYLRIRRK